MPRFFPYGSLAAAALLLSLAPSALARTVHASNETLLSRACQPPHDTLGFCDTSAPIATRVAALIALLRDDEIPPQLTARHGGGGNPGPKSNVSRIGLPNYDWGANCIHGAQTSCVQLPDGSVVCPTTFPTPVSFGFTFHDSLAFDMGAVIADEMRALWLLGATEYDPWSGLPPIGLDCWCVERRLASTAASTPALLSPNPIPHLSQVA